MPRPIPIIRERLVEIGTELSAMGARAAALGQEVQELALETRRRSPVHRGRNQHKPLTDDQKAQIHEYAEAFPDATYKDISLLFDTSVGRISEVLAGKRDET